MDWKSNKWVWIVVGVTIFNVMLFGMSELIVRRTTNKVIEKLQKEYSPSPYGPGFDPDKVNPDSFKRKVEFRFNKEDMPAVTVAAPNPVEEKVVEAPKPKVEEKDWLDEWEKQRKD